MLLPCETCGGDCTGPRGSDPCPGYRKPMRPFPDRERDVEQVCALHGVAVQRYAGRDPYTSPVPVSPDRQSRARYVRSAPIHEMVAISDNRGHKIDLPASQFTKICLAYLAACNGRRIG